MRLGRSGDVCTGAQLPASTRRTTSRCTCSCRAMVPTRHFSTACIRRICATRSGAMVMAPDWACRVYAKTWAMTQEALAHPGGLQPGTARAQPGRGGGGGRGRGGDRGGGRRICGLGRRGGVVCPYGQWSRSHPGWATLVRHVLLKATTAITAITTVTATPTPAPRPFRMGKPAAPRPLVAARTLAPSGVARQAPTLPTTVAVATVAMAAQHDLGAASRAQEQAPWSIHAHPGREPKVQCWTDASQRCHTDAAPPSSARCRARYGCQASRRDWPLPRPPSSA